MCGFCAGLPGVPHWTESGSDAARLDAAELGHELKLERALRVRIVDRVLAHYGCTVSDWMGGAYLVSSLRGRTELVDRLPQVWQIVEDIAGRPLDPLDPVLLAALADAR
ncbi:MAG: hypothetical protein HY749_02780 [Gammaproteobacteria bacterium]|nr:hypothetical protein [Gammaproteobacteria bacterium]